MQASAASGLIHIVHSWRLMDCWFPGGSGGFWEPFRWLDRGPCSCLKWWVDGDHKQSCSLVSSSMLCEAHSSSVYQGAGQHGVDWKTTTTMLEEGLGWIREGISYSPFAGLWGGAESSKEDFLLCHPAHLFKLVHGLITPKSDLAGDENLAPSCDVSERVFADIC